VTDVLSFLLAKVGPGIFQRSQDFISVASFEKRLDGEAETAHERQERSQFDFC
jgi:hypothetical protein